jgi:hypothetical protein
VEHVVPIAPGTADVRLTTLADVDVDRLVAVTAPVFAQRAATPAPAAGTAPTATVTSEETR